MRKIALLLAITACSDLTAPVVASGYEQFDPPAEYHAYWSAVVKCSGIPASMHRVRFYRYPDSHFIPDTPLYMGMTFAATHQAFFGGKFWDYPPVVRHEMLHDILGPGVAGHPPEYYGKGGRCYDLVWG